MFDAQYLAIMVGPKSSVSTKLKAYEIVQIMMKIGI